MRELAHRRLAMSVVRQVARVVSLHLLDAAAIAISVVIAAGVSGVGPRSQILPALVAFTLVGLNLRGSYRPGDARRDFRRLVTAVLIAVVLAAIPFTIRAFPLPPLFLAVFGLTAFAMLALGRKAVDALLHVAYSRGIGLRRALILARGEDYRHILSDITPHQVGRPAEDQLIVGYVTPEAGSDPSSLGSLAELEHALERHDISELIVATALRGETLAKAADVCFEMGVRVLVLPAASASRSVWADVTRVGRLPAYQLHPTRLEFPSLAIKRGCDLVLAGAGLLVSLPVMVIIAACIKLESPGRVFFRQRRVGLGGRHFMMWKFRSMFEEAETRRDDLAHLNAYGDERLFKLPRDPRITRVGRVLRRFSLDELPQLLNVITGDMALVGPRPPLPSEVRTYEQRHFVRLSVVPGLTGPWQVNGRNLITDFEEVVRLEREYIETWSLGSDLEIMIRTVGVVLSGKGAY